VVLRGQYLERPTLVDAEGVTLEALYHRGSRPPPLLVCAPHGIARALALLPEIAPAVDPAALAAVVGPNGRLDRITGANARFLNGLPLLGRLAAEWLG
jgi:hypothetical protein